MTTAERIVVALMVGLINGAFVAAASLSLHLHHIWPGAVFGFALTTLTTLAFLRRRNTR